MTAASISFDPSLARAPTPARGKSFVHRLALWAVALTVATSGIVMSEPAPVDALTAGLILLLPLVGLVTINRTLFGYFSLWMIAGAGALFATTLSLDLGETMTHVAVTLYLYAATFVFAGFVARNPRRHTELSFNAWTVAALIACTAAIIGYYDLVSGSYELFTKYDRAAGTFKDPNVFAPFLVIPILYMVARALERPARRMFLPLAIAGYLTLGVFLSFSRGAWINLAVSLALFGYLSFVTSKRAGVRLKIIGLLSAGLIIGTGIVLAALTSNQVANAISERASLDQTYDEGSEGRFGGQQKAVDLIANNPLGIGAQEFTSHHHPEEVHNVYLSILLNAGWIGGAAYWILVALTIALGFRHALKPTETRVLFLVAYSTFVAVAFEGLIVDTDHWRSFYLLMAVVWGLMAADHKPAAAPFKRTPRLVGVRRVKAPVAARTPTKRRRPRVLTGAPA